MVGIVYINAVCRFAIISVAICARVSCGVEGRQKDGSYWSAACLGKHSGNFVKLPAKRPIMIIGVYIRS